MTSNDGTFCVPSILDDETVARAILLLDAIGDMPEVVFDFSEVTFVRPYATLVLASVIQRFRDSRKERHLETRYVTKGVEAGTRPNGSSYLAHVGFFQYLGIPHGKKPGEAKGSDTYVPMRQLTSTDLANSHPGMALHDAINAESERLAGLVCGPDDDAYPMLQYCFCETIRNAFEHAKTDRCLVMGQKYSNGFVELAVVDAGRGVQASLAESFTGITCDEALSRSILPGITRSTRDEGLEEWENTGFGLYVLSSLARDTGDFSLWSGERCLCVDGEATYQVDRKFQGTAVKVRLGTDNAEYFPNVLHAIVAHGERHLAPGAVRKTGRSKSKHGGW